MENQIINSTFPASPLDVAVSCEERPKMWGWLAPAMTNVCLFQYKRIDGKIVCVTSVTKGPEPVDPYEGRSPNVKMVGELTSFVRIFQGEGRFR